MRFGLVMAAVALAAPVAARDTPPTSDPAARQILEQAVAAAGGDAWLRPATLVLAGSAEFFAPDRTTPVRAADDYRMWRKLDPKRQSAHAADGKVHIRAMSDGKVMFEVGYDGETTWTDKGVMPKPEADAMWAANFGFGIIRQALGNGFTVESVPGRAIDGHRLDMIRIIDPGGGKTLFGIDAESHFIRYMGFATPRGWHERVYDDFMQLENPRWVQARTVTLLYDGVKQNVVHWREARIGTPIPDSEFAYPGK